MNFDPSKFAKDLQSILVSDKKRIGFLFGSGTSFCTKSDGLPFVPTISVLTQNIEEKEKTKYGVAIDSIVAEVSGKNDIETLLSEIDNKISAIGSGTLNGLQKEGFVHLKSEIEAEIKNEVGIQAKFALPQIKKMPHYLFGSWIKRAARNQGIEIFTTNYDYLFEIAFESLDLPFYDGFTGSYHPFFNAASTETFDYLPNEIKLWKIHGSLGWSRNLENKQVIREDPSQGTLLIYPSITKYENSTKQPYVALLDRLSLFLAQDDCVLFVFGYSFGDQHINERIKGSLINGRGSHVFVFYYDLEQNGEYLLKDDSFLAEMAKETPRFSVYGTKTAVINGTFGFWKLSVEPSKDDTPALNAYFDEDAPVNTKAKLNEKETSGLEWTGLGKFILPDFGKFCHFLASLTTESNSSYKNE